jgi:hypothetical protein
MKKPPTAAQAASSCVSLHEMPHSSLHIRRLLRLSLISLVRLLLCFKQSSLLISSVSQKCAPVTPALFIIIIIITTHTCHFFRTIGIFSRWTLRNLSQILNTLSSFNCYCIFFFAYVQFFFGESSWIKTLMYIQNCPSMLAPLRLPL